MLSELVENEEFDSMVPSSCKPLEPKAQFKKTISENACVVLIKGTILEPADEESKSLVQQLSKLNI